HSDLHEAGPAQTLPAAPRPFQRLPVMIKLAATPNGEDFLTAILVAVHGDLPETRGRALQAGPTEVAGDGEPEEGVVAIVGGKTDLTGPRRRVRGIHGDGKAGRPSRRQARGESRLQVKAGGQGEVAEVERGVAVIGDGESLRGHRTGLVRV